VDGAANQAMLKQIQKLKKQRNNRKKFKIKNPAIAGFFIFMTLLRSGFQTL
jgi:hypothetical protein